MSEIDRDAGADPQLYEQVAEKLRDLGWRSDCDAQWTNLRDALPQLRALLNPPIEDGGPAFPWGEHGSHLGGMTLRDYAAIHSTQPGEAEVATAAGLTYSSGRVWKSASECLGDFNDWFNALPLDERCRLCAVVRYAQADAMLKARAA